MGLLALPAILEIGGRLLDKVIPDPEQRARAQLELMRLQQEGAFKEMDADLQLSLAQTKINEIEAAQGNIFNSGWRPGAGWVCVVGLAYEFLIRTMLPWLLTVAGVQGVPPLPSLDGVLMELLFGMLGLGTLRTFDKAKRLGSMAGK